MKEDYFGYQNKVCLVTGASSEIGIFVCEKLKLFGAKVFAIGTEMCPIEDVVFYKCDLSKKGEIDETFEMLPRQIDCYFGITDFENFESDYKTIFNSNFLANKYITLEYLTKRMVKGGSITYVTSLAGKHWQNYLKEQTPFIKAATWKETEKEVLKLAKISPPSFANILAKRCLAQFSAEQSILFCQMGIRVNIVMASGIFTGMKDEMQNMTGVVRSLLDLEEIGEKLAMPEEIAMPIIFMGSSMASFISGIDLVIDKNSSALITLKKKKDSFNWPVTNKFIIQMAKKMIKKGK